MIPFDILDDAAMASVPPSMAIAFSVLRTGPGNTTQAAWAVGILNSTLSSSPFRCMSTTPAGVCNTDTKAFHGATA